MLEICIVEGTIKSLINIMTLGFRKKVFVLSLAIQNENMKARRKIKMFAAASLFLSETYIEEKYNYML